MLAGGERKVLGVKDRLSVISDAARSRLWPVPTVALLFAVAAGVLLPDLDTRVDGTMPDTLSAYLFGGGSDAARTVLSSIAGSLITVTSLTFSLTVVTLQLASSQFSPRLLRTFSRDRFVHRTLGLFLATFAYSLVVLRTVRTSTDAESEFVPKISITVAVVMALVSVFGLVLFLDHLATQIRVETMLDDVHKDASEALQRVLEERPQGGDSSAVPPAAPCGAHPIEIAKSGFLLSFDEDDLLEAAVEADAIVHIQRRPGTSLVRGTPLGLSWPMGAAAIPKEKQQRLDNRVAAAAVTGRERTAAQDITYGLRQLTDVAIKALSPGINDPTTAEHALGHISSLLCELVAYQHGPKLVRDEQDRVRVVLDRPEFADLLDGALAQPRHYASNASDVLVRLTVVLREIAWRVEHPSDRQAVRDQLRQLRETVEGGDLAIAAKAELNRLSGLVEDSLAGRW